jgi:ribose 5-phosphate isomerase A
MVDPKEVLANYVIEFLEKSNIIGLGTGKTIRKVIEIINKKIDLASKLFIATSLDTEILLSNLGYKVLSLVSGITPDIYIDSFDIFNGKVLIKGGGAALFREKLIASNSKFRIYIGEYNKYKRNEKIYIVPIEVPNIAVNYVINKLKKLGFKVVIRNSEKGKIGPIVSDNGNVIIDVEVNNENLCEISELFKRIVGIIETGVFCSELYDMVIIADESGRLEVFKKG